MDTARGRALAGLLLALLWPAALAGATAARVTGTAPGASAGVYLLASTVCHQREDRSFSTAEVAWPVCGRCAGLYLGAAAGALIAFVRPHRRQGSRTLALLVLAAMPTLVTLGLEWWSLAPVGNLSRAVAAWPLGLAIAGIVMGELARPAAPIK